MGVNGEIVHSLRALSFSVTLESLLTYTNIALTFLLLLIRGLTIKFANSPTCAYRGSSGQKPQYRLMTLAYRRFRAVLLLIYGSLFLSGVYYCLSVFWCLALRQCTCSHGTLCERVFS
jgi:hypothetical protein